MPSTAGTILDHVWKILRTNGSSTDVPALQESFMLTLLSQANMEWLRAHRRGGGSGPLTFLRETGIDLVGDTAINDSDGVETSDTTLTVDSNSFPDSSGVAAIWDDNMPDLFSYTARTSTTFTGVTGLAFAHEDDDVVQALYKLPTNFKTFRPSDSYQSGVQVNGITYNYREGPPESGYFSLYDDGTSKYLWLPRGTTGSASVFYEKTSTTIDDTDDTVDVPQEHEFFLVWRIVETVTIPKNSGEVTQLHLTAKSEAAKRLKEALTDRNINQHVRVRQFKPYGSIPRDPALYARVPR